MHDRKSWPLTAGCVEARWAGKKGPRRLRAQPQACCKQLILGLSSSSVKRVPTQQCENKHSAMRWRKPIGLVLFMWFK